MKNGLPKAEVLHKRDDISSLMKDGKSFAKHPVRVVYSMVDSENPEVLVFFSAPKRNFKRAVDRNRVKRLLREAYRLNKFTLVETAHTQNKTIHLAFLFTGRELPSFTGVQDKIILILQRLKSELTPNS